MKQAQGRLRDRGYSPSTASEIEKQRLPGVGFVPGPFDQVQVVQFERRQLGADARQLGEVVPRRRPGCGHSSQLPTGRRR